MGYTDLREWLKKAEELDELVRVSEEVDWNLEMSTITDIAYRERGRETPAIIFENIKGYSKGYCCLYGSLNSPQRLALTLGLPTNSDINLMEYVELYKEKLKSVKPLSPQYVLKGPIMENVHIEDEVNLLEFPVPFHHEFDGGRYIGTGNCVITADPDSNWINVGTYRMMLLDKTKAISYMSPGRHGRIQRDKYLNKGKPAPMVVVLGGDPLLYCLAASEMAEGISEYDLFSGLKGEPVKLIKDPYTNLPFPADAEIVLSGEVSPTETALEGPFGEWPGYYCSRPSLEPVFKVKAVYHRNNPILNCATPSKPPHGHSFQLCLMRSALIWEALEKADISDIRGVWCHEAGGGYYFTVVSIKQHFYGHSRMAANIAANCRVGSYANRYTIVVDEDIDPADLNSVVWAMSTRSDPSEDIEISTKGWSSKLDPLMFDKTAYYKSSAIIDACKPFEHINDFPLVAQSSLQLEHSVKEKWKNFLVKL